VFLDDYVLACYRYIEMNPVRAAMVSRPQDYRWSSYHVNAQGNADSLILRQAAAQAGRYGCTAEFVMNQERNRGLSLMVLSTALRKCFRGRQSEFR